MSRIVNVGRNSSARRINYNDLQVFMRVCGASEADIDRCNQLLEQLKTSRPMYHAWHSTLTDQQIEFYEAIDAADQVRHYAPGTFPAFLRTPDYDDAVFDPYPAPGSWSRLRDLLQAQRWRAGVDSLHLIVGEQVLVRASHWPEQLDLLQEVIEAGAVVQIYPFAAPLLGSVAQPFTIARWFGLPLATQSAVSWLHADVEWVESQRRQGELRILWEDLTTNAASAPSTSKIVERVRRHGEGGLAALLP